MPGHLVHGHRAGGRYRLETELGHGRWSSVWRAVDETLERQVALRFFDPALDRTTLLEHAGAAASLTHPHIVRLFDTGFDGGQLFTVCELLPGSLTWARLPLAPDEVVRLAVQIADALAYAHQRGVAHGGLHSGNVLLGEQGAKVADFGLAAAPLPASPKPSQDLADLGELIYRLLTGRERSAAASPGRPLPDEPRGLVRVVLGLVDGAYEDAPSVLKDLQQLLPAPPRPERRRLWPLAAGAVALLLALTALGATRLGRRVRESPQPTPPPPVSAHPYSISSVADFDPLGNDKQEGHATVAKIADGDTQTFWATEGYTSAAFSGLKEGVGVIFDLGAPRSVGQARVLLAALGCSFELRYSPVRARNPDDWTVVASKRRAGRTTALVPRTPVRSRWWLLWITELTQGVPGARGSYMCGVSEVALYPP